jgi:protein-disulfide isomerase
VALVAVVAIIAVVILNVNRPAAAGPRNMADNGIVFAAKAGKAVPVLSGTPKTSSVLPAAVGSDGIAHITTYIDWSCPICKNFEASYASTIASMVAKGTATLEVHPVAILDRSFLGTRYSSRAANAAACVANYQPAKFLAAQGEFYDSQPAEGTSGLTNAQIKKLLVKAGATNPEIASCVDDERFKTWVAATTKRAASTSELVGSSGFGTPTVLVNGTKWDSSTDFAAFVASATK